MLQQVTDGTLVKAIAKAQKEAAEREIKQVANQPHRRGDAGKMAGSNLGQFILGNFTADMCFAEDSKKGLEDYQREVMEACEAYARVRWSWARAKGVPLPMTVAWDFGGVDVEHDKLEELVAKWREVIVECERAMSAVGRLAFYAAADLILYDYLPRIEHFGNLRGAIQRLHMMIYG